jgi:hypothetical protein
MTEHGSSLNMVANPSGLEPVLTSWRHLTARAQSLAQSGERRQAVQLLQQALKLGELLFDQWHDPEEAVAMNVASHHNLADLLSEQGEPSRAVAHLLAIHQCLQRLHGNVAEPADRRAAARRHMDQTLTRLQIFAFRHGKTWSASSFHADRAVTSRASVSMH